MRNSSYRIRRRAECADGLNAQTVMLDHQFSYIYIVISHLYGKNRSLHHFHNDWDNTVIVFTEYKT